MTGPLKTSSASQSSCSLLRSTPHTTLFSNFFFFVLKASISRQLVWWFRAGGDGAAPPSFPASFRPLRRHRGDGDALRDAVRAPCQRVPR